MPLPRRQLGELLTMHRLEKDLRDIFVEGPSDKKVVRAILNESGIDDAIVHNIEELDIPADMLERYGLTPGQRQRLIALALVCGEKLAPDSRNISCWIDSDFEIVLRELPANSFLLVTDFACAEGYLWTRQALSRLLRFHVTRIGAPIPTVIESLNDCLKQLYLLRAAAAVIQTNIRWIPFKDFVSLEGERIKFDRDPYVKRTLIACGHASKKSALDAAYKQIEPKVPADCRHTMNGHDALELLALCVKGLRPGSNKLHSEELFLNLYMAADWPQITCEQSVSKLLLRTQRE